ncbi:MAG TPA: RNA polymerase sigma factor [Gemmataceae bacterium]|jgi:RNA polymerase sigma factor (sigma-70 family)|nr:RNA polymerase sigma factor [Gemmataceae bacterium]
MATAQLSTVVRQLRGALARQDGAGRTEADLWERYVQRRDESAFEALLRRHGPMVLGVCRRILRHEQDAEDAFQATFLVLVRRAASLQSPGTIANWLHGVACRTALEARSAAAKRRAKEAAVPPRPVTPEGAGAELWPVLDQELGRLAEKYRVVVVLCDLEGKTRKEVAHQLGWAEGTVASRLARGRGLLAKRLARRGFTGAVVAVALAAGTAPACVPAGLVASTVKAVGAASRVVLSAKVIALTEGALKTMFLTKVKSATVALLVLGVAALGAGGLISRAWATRPAGGMPDTQQQAPASPDDLHERALELKRQLQQMQQKVARLEQETQAGRGGRNSSAPSLAKLFRYRVPFEIGSTESKDGGRIEIREVWGTRPRIEVGGQYLVRGKYVLPPGERGKLYFYATAGGAWGALTTTLDLQSTAVDKPEGEFTLVHGMSGPGYFHLILTDPERYSRCFANVYFGTGDNVLRKKTW